MSPPFDFLGLTLYRSIAEGAQFYTHLCAMVAG